MGRKKYDVFIIGHISIDEIVFNGVSEKLVGGAVVYSSFSATAGGNKVGALTKVAISDTELLRTFNTDKQDVYYVPSNRTTSIRNEFLSEDRERRRTTAISLADSFKVQELPQIEAKVYYLGGLIAGEFDEELLDILCKREVVAVDMQGFLRHAVDGEMIYRDWENKYKYLSQIDYLKVDAAEAEVMTGYTDRREAAKALYNMGAKEVMLTYNTEVLIYDGGKYYACPFKHRNLSGRTGRGDTCFSAYITERLRNGIQDSLLYAAALTSLKMESPGPFKGTRLDVERYIVEFY